MDECNAKVGTEYVGAKIQELATRNNTEPVVQVAPACTEYTLSTPCREIKKTYIRVFDFIFISALFQVHPSRPYQLPYGVPTSVPTYLLPPYLLALVAGETGVRPRGKFDKESISEVHIFIKINR
jgi:hypothetical protein